MSDFCEFLAMTEMEWEIWIVKYHNWHSNFDAPRFPRRYVDMCSFVYLLVLAVFET